MKRQSASNGGAIAVAEKAGGERVTAASNGTREH